MLRTLALEPGEHDLLGILNDRIADGRDVSWILGCGLRGACGSGAKSHLLRHEGRGARSASQVRGSTERRIAIVPEIETALGQAADSNGQAPNEKTLYMLPTYTAMLELRSLLVRRGEVNGQWS